MLLAALLVLGYGPTNWAFPWWVWTFGVIIQMGENIYRANTPKKMK